MEFFLLGEPGEALPVTCEKDIFDIIGKEYVEPEQRNVWSFRYRKVEVIEEDILNLRQPREALTPVGQIHS